MHRKLPMTAIALAALTLGAGPGAARQGDGLMERARALHRSSPLVDGHNDYPWEVRQRAGLDLDKLDIRQPQPSIMTDIPRLRAGGLGAQFWSVYVPVDFAGASASYQIHYAEKDRFISPDEAAFMEATMGLEDLDVTIHTYPGTEHGFADPESPAYDEEAAAMVLSRATSFLKERL